jgi:hypothetical protein
MRSYAINLKLSNKLFLDLLQDLLLQLAEGFGEALVAVMGAEVFEVERLAAGLL